MAFGATRSYYIKETWGCLSQKGIRKEAARLGTRKISKRPYIPET